MARDRKRFEAYLVVLFHKPKPFVSGRMASDPSPASKGVLTSPSTIFTIV
jgi:hypothetical protein